MSIQIHPIQMGIAKSYIIQDKGVIMIGDGSPKKIKKFKKGLEKTSIKPEEIQLIILTHGHFDHAGAAKELKEITGAQIVMHHLDKDFLEKGLKNRPPGLTTWGCFLRHILNAFYAPFAHFPVANVDVIVGDEGMTLAEYGIRGKILHTPGHTSGSISVVLESGDAFVGCLAMNALPLSTKPSLPIFGEDAQALKESWKLVLAQGAKTIYPAHGGSFSAEIVRKKFL